MTRVWLGLAVVSMSLVSVEAPAQSAREGTAPPADSERLWVQLTASWESEDASLKVNGLPMESTESVLRFNCELTVESLDWADVVMEVSDSSGKTLHSATLELRLQKGTNPLVFVWDTQDLPNGTYAATFRVEHAIQRVVARVEMSVSKLSQGTLDAAIADAAGRVAQLPPDQEGGVSYAALKAHVAGWALEKARASFEKGNWPRAHALAMYSAQAADAARALLTFGSLVPELSADIAQPDLSKIEVRDGAFQVDGRPVFLMGAFGVCPPGDALDDLCQYGLNLAVFEFGPKDTVATDGGSLDIAKALDPLFDKAKECNVSVTCQLAPHLMAPWAFEKWPEMTRNPFGVARFDMNDKHAKEVIQRHVDHLVPYLARQEMLNSICVAHKPEFAFAGQDVRAGFIDAVGKAYGDRRDVNRAWSTRLRKLEEVDIWWDFDRPSYQYLLQTYHQRLGTDYLCWLKQAVDDRAPGVPTHAKLMDNEFVNGEARLGVDREALARTMPVSGCSSANTLSDVDYALGYPQQVLHYTLLKSLAPDKPVFNSEAYYLFDRFCAGDEAYRYVHAATWEGAMAGLNACALPLGSKGSSNAGAELGVFDEPEYLEGFATACLDLNRLGDIVTAFQRAPAEVYILWSMSSKIYDDGDPYLESVKRAFEGCDSFGYKVAFMTEQQCIDGGLERAKVLVIPNAPALSDAAFSAIDKHAAAGGVVIRVAKPATYDPRGASRHDVISYTDHTILLRADDSPTGFLHAMDAVESLGLMDSIPRMINRHGYPLEGVKSRHVTVDGQDYLYVVNLRKTPVLADLNGPRRSGRDLIEGRAVKFPQDLQPLDPMLVKLDPVSEEQSEASEDQEEASGIPTAVLLPVEQ